MIGTDEIKLMEEEIAEMQKELNARKKELQDKRYAGLREAMQNRKNADQMLQEELRALGIKTINWGSMF